MRRFLGSTPGFGLLRRIKQRVIGAGASRGYRPISAAEITAEMAAGWQDESIPEKQRRIVNTELAQMRAGQAPRQFAVVAQAVRQTGCPAPTILEVGCASGFYAEVLAYLLGSQVRYAGLDYSLPLLRLAQETYPQVPFLNGDATRLPFADASWDVVISGCVILHVADWQAAVAETARVAKVWCIFHRTPVCNGPTRLTTKLAYGVKVIEWHFHEPDLLAIVRTHGFELVSALPIVTGETVEGMAGEVSSVTYLFTKTNR